MTMLTTHLRRAALVTVALMIVTGIAYPAIVTALAQLLFPHQANGSLIVADGRIIGSELIGQRFTRPEYFQGRPSAAGAGYDDTISGASNKGPTDRTLADSLVARAVDTIVAVDGGVKGRIPSDLVTASGSGLDPHLSPASAELQVERVARARAAAPDSVRRLVHAATEGRQFGIFGEPRVNVLRLNRLLDRWLPLSSGATAR